MKLKGGISRWSQRFYIGREHMVCTDLNNSSRWWRVSQSLVWKSFSGCLLAFYCFDVGYFYCKFGCILNSWKVRPWFWSSKTLFFLYWTGQTKLLFEQKFDWYALIKWGYLLFLSSKFRLEFKKNSTVICKILTGVEMKKRQLEIATFSVRIWNYLKIPNWISITKAELFCSYHESEFNF